MFYHFFINFLISFNRARCAFKEKCFNFFLFLLGYFNPLWFYFKTPADLARANKNQDIADFIDNFQVCWFEFHLFHILNNEFLFQTGHYGVQKNISLLFCLLFIFVQRKSNKLMMSIHNCFKVWECLCFEVHSFSWI